jgi:peroxiredoxin
MRRPVGICGRTTAAGVLTLICFLPAAAPQQPTPASTPNDSKSAADSSSLLGKDAPAFVVKTLGGKQVSLADYKGKPVVVNFWATWCEACRQEMPWLAELRERYRPQGFEVLGIVTDRASPEKIASAVESYGVKYPILFCNHATAQAYGGLPELPVSFFIDRRGKIIAKMTGADSKEEIEARIKEVLSK